MDQFRWTYVNDEGKQHVVGLYHGPSSGHLLVHCNGSIVLIDFHVRESKTYRLFIDDELFDLKLDRRGDRFVYTFEINRTADTPRNRRRRAFQRRDLRKSLFLLGGFVAVVVLAVASFRWQRSSSGQQVTTLAHIESAPSGAWGAYPPDSAGRPLKVTYSFTAGGERVSGSMALPEDAGAVMPLTPGDEFLVTYLTHRPEAHQLDLRRPSRSQLARYRDMAVQRLAAARPDLSSERAECLVDQGFQRFGTEAYVAFYRYQYPEAVSEGRSAEAILRALDREGVACPTR